MLYEVITMAVNRMPDYRRVDLGLMKDLRGKNPKPNGLLDEFWLSLEVFNLFDIQNTISYFCVITSYSIHYTKLYDL